MFKLKNESIAIPVVLFAGILWSFGPLVVRYMDQPNLVPWQYLFGRGITIFVLLNLYLFFAGLFGTLLHLCINHAFKLVDVSMTQPYSFLSLVFASLIGYYVFSEIPDLFTWIGASIIFLGVLIMSYREMKLDKEIIRKRLDIKN